MGSGLLSQVLARHAASAQQAKDTQAQFYLDAIRSGNLSPVPNPNNDPQVAAENEKRAAHLDYATQQLNKLYPDKNAKGAIQFVRGMIDRAHAHHTGQPPPPPGMRATTQVPPQPPPPPSQMAGIAGAAYPSQESQDARSAALFKQQQDILSASKIKEEQARSSLNKTIVGTGEPIPGEQLGKPKDTWWKPITDPQGNVLNYIQTGTPPDVTRGKEATDLENLRQKHRQEIAEYNAKEKADYARLTGKTGVSAQQWQALNHDPAYIDANQKVRAAESEIKRLSDIIATGKDPTGKTLLGGATLTTDKAQQIQGQISQQQQAVQDALKEMEDARNRVVFGGNNNSSKKNGAPPPPPGISGGMTWDAKAGRYVSSH